LGKVPLVIGMPVVITNNFDVGGGIVNGTYGILKKIRYTCDNAERRHATSCIVELPSPVGQPMSGLTNSEVPVIEQESRITF
ncbi:hypothetical protein K435DRAFT_581764, partial [Dendrothele bispora CBS 962.96]